MLVIKQTVCGGGKGTNVSETLKILRTLWDTPSSKRAIWSPERRQQQALRCRQFQPWRKSTGPRTELGKARSSLNSRSNRNKRDAQNFDIVAALVMEIERLKQENELLKAKESHELRSEVTSSKTNPMKDHQQKTEK